MAFTNTSNRLMSITNENASINQIQAKQVAAQPAPQKSALKDLTNGNPKDKSNGINKQQEMAKMDTNLQIFIDSTTEHDDDLSDPIPYYNVTSEDDKYPELAWARKTCEAIEKNFLDVYTPLYNSSLDWEDLRMENPPLDNSIDSALFEIPTADFDVPEIPLFAYDEPFEVMEMMHVQPIDPMDFGDESYFDESFNNSY